MILLSSIPRTLLRRSWMRGTQKQNFETFAVTDCVEDTLPKVSSRHFSLRIHLIYLFFNYFSAVPSDPSVDIDENQFNDIHNSM